MMNDKKISEDPRPACGWQAAAGRCVPKALTISLQSISVDVIIYLAGESVF
jgi:hypothetical protein